MLMNSLMADLQIYRLIYIALRWTEVGFVYRVYVVDVLVTTIFGLLYNKRWSVNMFRAQSSTQHVSVNYKFAEPLVTLSLSMV